MEPGMGQQRYSDNDLLHHFSENEDCFHVSPWERSGHVLVLSKTAECGCSDCCQFFPDESTTLRKLAAKVVAKWTNKMLVNTVSLNRAAEVLRTLKASSVTLVIAELIELRPRRLPLEYHWAPTEQDPILCLICQLPLIVSLSYRPHPLSYPCIEGALSKFTALVSLSFPGSADDSLLRILGRACRHLIFINLMSSKSVTDSGLRRLMLKAPAASRFHWRQLYRRWQELRTSLPSPPAIVPYRPMFTTPASPGVESPQQRTAIASTIRHLDLRGTRVSAGGSDWVAKRLRHGAHVLIQPSASRFSRRSRTSSEESMLSLLSDS